MASENIDALSDKTVSNLHLSDRYLGKSVRMVDRWEPGENDLERDLFWTLFRHVDEFKTEPPASRIVNKKILDWLMGGATWGNTKSASQGRKLISQYAAEFMTESLLNDPAVKEMLKEQKKIEEQEKKAEKQEQEEQENPPVPAPQVQAQEGPGGAGGGKPTQSPNQPKSGQNPARIKANSMAKSLGEQMDKLIDSPKGRAMAAALNKQAQKAEQDANDLMTGWGVGENDDEGANIDPNTLKDMLSKVKDSKIENITRLIGRAKGVAQHTLSHRKHLELVTTDAGYTKNPDDIFSDELMLLSPSLPKEVRSVQMGKLLDDGLLGTVKAVETKEEGNMVVAVDGSGSMKGDREILAKALTLGICEAARDNGQEYQVFTFGDGHEISDVITSETSPVKRFQWASFLFGGNTDFDNALRYAIKLVKDNDDPTVADIVMITDGKCGINASTQSELRQLKEEFGVRLITILMQCSGMGSINRISDAVIQINDTTDIDKAAEDLSQTVWQDHSGA